MPFRQNQKSSLGGNAVTYRILRASMAYSERSNMRAGNWAGQAQYCTTVMLTLTELHCSILLVPPSAVNPKLNSSHSSGWMGMLT